MDAVIDIYEYLDYKKYLVEWRIESRKVNTHLTHEYICRALGQNNRSYFSDIEKGRKVIGSEVLDRLIKLIGLKGDESKYFRALVGYGQCANYSEEEFWFERLMELNKAPRQHLTKEKYSYFKEWYHSAVRSYLDTANFKDEYETLVKDLYNRITQDEAKKSVELLLTLGLIAENDEGYLKPTDKVVSAGDDVRHECIKAYNISNNEILQSILEKGEPGTHNSSLVTVSVSQKGLALIEKRIFALRQEIMAIAHKDDEDANGVYQVALHAFPLCRQAKSK